MPKNAPNIIRRTIDLDNPPKITPEQKKRLAAIAAMPDSEIDYSDAPHRPDAVWTKSQRFSLRNKHETNNLHIDADILDWFKATGSRYQTRINDILRHYVETQEAADSPRSGTTG